MQAREGRARARAYMSFSLFCCHIVTFSYKTLIMNGLCVTKSVTKVTNGDDGFWGCCHMYVIVLQKDYYGVTMVTKNIEKTLF